MSEDTIKENLLENNEDVGFEDEDVQNKISTATRKDIQLGRRLFHASAGIIISILYWGFFTHQRAIYALGFGASILYLLEQIRINYPKSSSRIKIINKYFLRGEEYLKESAAMPYTMALLLTIISFPQPVAIASILTLALGDPLSAIIGIRFGRHHIVSHKTIEGSIAFFIACFLSIFLVFYFTFDSSYSGKILGISFVVALFCTIFEMIPLKLDDNLTIPLFTAVILWVLGLFAGMPL